MRKLAHLYRHHTLQAQLAKCLSTLNFFNRTRPYEQSSDGFAQIWGFSMLSVGLMTCFTATCIILLPSLRTLRKSVHEVITTFAFGLGVGTLTGTTFFQVFPEAFEIDRDDDIVYIPISWLTIVGMMSFFVFDRCVKIHIKSQKIKEEARAKLLPAVRYDGSDVVLLPREHPTKLKRQVTKRLNLPHYYTGFCGHVIVGQSNVARGLRKVCKMCLEIHNLEPEDTLSTETWLLLIGHGGEKFVDGLCIGAGYANSTTVGVGILLAELFEELPHILGDAGLLLFDCSPKKAILMNFGLSLPCFVGMALGIILERFTHLGAYIFALTGGVFSYVTLSNLVPQMVRIVENAVDQNKAHAFRLMFLQFLGMCTGLIVIYLINYFQEEVNV